MSALDDLQYPVPSDFKDSFHPLCSAARRTNFADGHMETTNSLTWMGALNGKERFGSGTESRLYKHARVMASWVGDEGEISLGISRPGRVNYFLEHSLLIRMDIVLFVCSGLKSIPTIRYLRTHCLFTMLRYLNFPVLQHSSLFKEFSPDLSLLTG
ncbi:unnamed protein product, partial [Porites evermanni]